jgi:hypothetical protein
VATGEKERGNGTGRREEKEEKGWRNKRKLKRHEGEKGVGEGGRKEIGNK